MKMTEMKTLLLTSRTLLPDFRSAIIKDPSTQLLKPIIPTKARQLILPMKIKLGI